MKKGRLSNEEVQFIQDNHEMSLEELSKELDRSEGTIAKVLASYTQEVKSETSTNEKIDFMNLVPKRKNFVGMSEALSQVIDDQNFRTKKTDLPYITTLKNDKST